LLEVLRMCSVSCQPFMPEKAIEMRAQLGLPATFNLDDADRIGDPSWKRIGTSAVLFPRIEVEQEKSK